MAKILQYNVHGNFHFWTFLRRQSDSGWIPTGLTTILCNDNDVTYKCIFIYIIYRNVTPKYGSSSSVCNIYNYHIPVLSFNIYVFLTIEPTCLLSSDKKNLYELRMKKPCWNKSVSCEFLFKL